MAHKHNRRRNRPRSRPNKTLVDFDSLSTSSSDSVGSSGLATNYRLPTRPPQPRLDSINNISARHWQNRYTAWQNRETAQRREAAQIEKEQLKMFGGEPGDDAGLCYKMIEAFEGMEWVNSLD